MSSLGTGTMLKGLRAWKEVAGKKTYFYYTENGLEAEYDEAGNVVRSYLYEPGGDWGTSPLMVRSGDERYFALNDHLGTPQKLVDTEGQEKWGARYSAFGIADVLTNTVENPLRFPGQYYDEETGLHQNGLRYYDPMTGSYLTMDPYGVAVTGFNRYSYALGNPVSFTDPTGEIVPVVALMIVLRVAIWVGAEAYFGWPTFRCAQFLSDPCKYPGGYEACQQAMLNAFLGWGLGRVVPFLIRPVAGFGRWLWRGVPGLGRGAGRAAKGLAEARRAFSQKLDDNVIARWNPVNGPEPLPVDVATTFRSATYNQVKLGADTVLYRAYGGNAREISGYWSRTQPSGPVQAIIDSALDRKWGNAATQIARIRVPKGTTIFEGAAAPQRGLVGGGNQVFIPEVNPAWLVK